MNVASLDVFGVFWWFYPSKAGCLIFSWRQSLLGQSNTLLPLTFVAN